jgi:hypothetical protein
MKKMRNPDSARFAESAESDPSFRQIPRGYTPTEYIPPRRNLPPRGICRGICPQNCGSGRRL